MPSVFSMAQLHFQLLQYLVQYFLKRIPGKLVQSRLQNAQYERKSNQNFKLLASSWSVFSY